MCRWQFKLLEAGGTSCFVPTGPVLHNVFTLLGLNLIIYCDYPYNIQTGLWPEWVTSDAQHKQLTN